MKIAALYARVSTQKQEKQETIDSQIAEIKTRVEADGYVLPPNNVFIDDGWSGVSLDRPGLDKLRDAGRAKTIEVLYVYDLGRLSRDFTTQLVLVDEIQNSGIKLISLHDINAENDEQSFARNVMGLFHDYERKKIAERFRRGKIYKARKGLIVHGPAAYGYDYVPKTEEGECHWVINEEEAEVVRKIFLWIADENLTLRGVVKRLYESKIPPKKNKRDVWSHGPVCRLVRDEVYIGKAYYNKSFAVLPENPRNKDHYKRVKKSSRRQRDKKEWILTPVPPILEKKLFYRVQERLKLNKKFNAGNSRKKYMLSGLVRCVCGRPRQIEGVRNHRYYRCPDAVYRHPLPRLCRSSGVNAFHLEDMVWGKVQQLFTNEELIHRQASRWTSKETKGDKQKQDSVVGLEQLLKKLDEEENRYVKAYGAGVLTLNQFQERVEIVRQRKGVLENDVSEAKGAKSRPIIDMALIDNLPVRFSNMLKSLSLEEKRLFLHEILEQVSVGDGTKVLVRGVIPLESEVQSNGFWTSGRNCRTT